MFLVEIIGHLNNDNDKDNNYSDETSINEKNNDILVCENATNIIKKTTFTRGMHTNAYFKADNFGHGKSKILARGTVIRLYDPELLLGFDMIDNHNTGEMMEDFVDINEERRKSEGQEHISDMNDSSINQNYEISHSNRSGQEYILSSSNLMVDNNHHISNFPRNQLPSHVKEIGRAHV